MPNIEEKIDRLIIDFAELKIDFAELKTAVKGYNGNQGLIPAFEQHCEDNKDFQKDYFKFKRKVLAVFFFLLGSGALGLSVVKIIEIVA